MVTTPPGEQVPGYGTERRLAVLAAEEAGALLRARLQGAGVAAVRYKSGGRDAVTDLDLLAEKTIMARLRGCYPQDRVLSEEAGLLDADSARTWLVDPLDGSNNVAIGLPACVVGIGLCVGDSPVVGVVHEPLTGETWQAAAGQGATGPAHRPLTGPARAGLPADPVLAWTQGHAVGREDVVARALRGALEDHCWRLLQLWAPLLAWSMLARGVIDGFVGYRAEGIDLPAGALLASEAGVEMRTLRGTPFHPRHTGPDTARSFVAGRPRAVDQLLDVLRPFSP